MQKRLVILVVLVVAVAGLLYWKADQSFRDHAGLPGMESSRPASLTLDDILGRDLRRVDVSDERVTTTQVPVVEATTAEIPDAENDEAPAASTAPVEMTKAVTAPPLESTPAVGASETTRSGEPWPQLPFAWMSPTQESQPGFVAPDREDARLPTTTLRPVVPNAPNLNRHFPQEDAE